MILLRSRDSGIMLDEEYWHHSSDTTDNNNDSPSSSKAPPFCETTKTATIQDPGLLILQVTQFGTIDHAFAIPQSAGDAKRRTGWFCSSSNSSSITNDDGDGDDNSNSGADDNEVVDTSVFLAHDRAAIEAMASEAVMGYVHPQELSALCKGLDQVCKALYTVFRARWRVDAPSSESMLSREDDDGSKVSENGLELKQGDRPCKIIEFQGERFEEWVDPSSVAAAAAMACVQGMSVKEGEDDEKENSCRYAWTEVTGVLSNGNVVLEEQEWLMASSPLVNTSARHLTSSSQGSSSSSSSFFAPIPAFVDYTDDDDDEDESEDEDGYLEMEMELGSLCSEKTLVPDDGAESKVDWRALTDGVRRRMDIEEGLSLSKSSSIAVSRLSDLSSLASSSSISTVSARSKLDSRVKPQQPPCHSNKRTLLITFSPTAAASSLVLVSLPLLSSIALDAWKQWVQMIHLTKEQFQAWSGYLLDLALRQTIETVSFGMTILGCAPRPCLSAPALMDYDYHYNYCNPAESDSSVQHALAQELRQRTTVMTIQKSHPPQEDEAIHKISGLNRAGKVLEAHHPGLEGAVRHLGQTWLGHRIMATVHLEEKLDVVADQVVDWWESDDRVAALVASSVPPLLNTLTAYTPLSFLSRRFVSARTTSM
ncbi:hypothetical protein BGZ70_009818 [Mortierella alpina]|uniref:Uncharacterized protein n=1 Tax=Mortierella alpina TaxID=64518 RepID=A0A9P6LZY6_MORAP|nr:hypothetical protein BGZ70_009818 [Mortierella alpina]